MKNFLALLVTSLLLAGGQNVFSQSDRALHFDGVNDYVQIPDADALDLVSSYTLECWIKPDAFNSLGGLISKYHSNSANGYLLRLGGTSPYNGLSFDGMETATGLLQTGTWYHIAAVKNGSQRKLYVNGEEKALSGGAVNVGPNTDFLTIGMDYAPSPRRFNGVIDDVRIWNTARTQAGIQAAMNTPIDPATAGLVAYYKFDQGTAGGDNSGLTAVTDATTGNHHGTAINFALTGSTSNWVGSYAMIVPVATDGTDISDTGFTANWTAPADGIPDHYLLDVSPLASFSTFLSGYSGLNVGNVMTWDLTGLPPGTTWYYRIRAVSTTLGQGAPSNVIAVTTTDDQPPLAPPGNALHFDGINDYVQIPDANTLDLTADYTLECWIRPDGFNFLAGLMSKYQSPAGPPGYLLRLGATAPYTGLGFDGLETANGILQAGNWYHIAAVKNGSSRTLYVNGVVQPLSGSAVTVAANTHMLALGVDYYSGDARYFKGAMDEVRIWNTARTQAEVQAAMNVPIDPATAGLVAYYKFDQGAAGADNSGLTPVTDAAGNHQGTAINFALNGSASNWVGSFAMVVPVATDAADVSDTGFTATWTAPAYGTPDHYLLDVSPSASFSTFLSGYNGLNVGNVTTRALTGLPSGTKWYYRVRAAGATLGQGILSNFIAVTTSGDYVPGKTILYVDKNVSGGDQSGDSWVNAIPELADALLWARQNQENYLWNADHPLQIWVAAGTYKPLYLAGDGQFTTVGTGNGARNRAFVLVKDVKIYGGFDPAEGITDLTHKRIPPSSGEGSILSGDLNNSNTVNNGDAYHVVVSAGEIGPAILDGFRITGGNANGTGAAATVNGLSMLNYDGGGIDVNASSPALGNLVISGNYGKYGGGIQLQNAPLTLTNSVISGNTADQGGGIYAYENSSLALTNATISGNRADYLNRGGGIYYEGSTLQVVNSIIFGNNTGIYSENGAPSQYSYSLVQEITTPDANGNINGGTNPLFTNRVSYSSAPSAGGDYSLKPGSPVIDKGTNSLFPGLDDSSTDLAGNPRVYDYANEQIIDMGAYEHQGEPGVSPTLGSILYVNKNVSGGDQSGDSWANAIPELADALLWARQNQENDLWEADNPLQIWVAAGTYKPLYLAADGQFTTAGTGTNIRNRAFVLVKDVKIYGGFDPANGITNLTHKRIPPSPGGGSILSGDLNNSNTVNNGDAYHVVVSAGVIGTAVLDGFSVTGGNANGSGASIRVNGLQIINNEAGGFEAIKSFPALSNLFISGNYGSYGGGISLIDASPALVNLVISGNSATWGGGIMNDGASVTLTNVTISGNSANQGGGIYNFGTLHVRNSIIHGNTSGINNAGGVPVQYAYSLVQGATGNDANGNIDGSTNPLFVNPANGDYTLQSDSPVIDMGSNALFSGLGAHTLDLAGNRRLVNGTIDLGAYEFGCTVTLASSGTVIQLLEEGQNYLYDACALFAMVEPADESLAGTSITAGVWVEEDIIAYQSARYVARHYDLVPGVSPESAAAAITLFFTKEDFQAYNIAYGTANSAALPVDDGDNVNNLKIVQYHGPGNTTGLPGSYNNGSRTIITPSSVLWDQGIGFWAVTFPVQGFSGFFVTGQSETTLPVTVLSFEARKHENVVDLNWQTTSEVLFDHFEIERSPNGRSWQYLGQAPSRRAGPGLYSFADLKPRPGKNYYRLRMVDLDGSYAYSTIRSVLFGNDNRTVLYPNPVTVSDRLHVLNDHPENIARIEIFRADGRRLILSNEMVIDTRHLAPGLYIVHVTYMEGGISNHRIIKN